MITESKYYQAGKTDKVWYDSSNIVYSEFKDDGNGKGQLFVTFKNGATYQYKDVDIATDYILFKHGGTNPDKSNGKALNQFIKPKYECERVSDKDMPALIEELQKTKDFNAFLKDKQNIYFVYGESENLPSGRNPVLDIYSPEIQSVCEIHSDSKFILADDDFGMSVLSNMLSILNIDAKRIRIYRADGLDQISDTTEDGIIVDGTFGTKQDMLEQMTRDSAHDIIHVTSLDSLTDSAKCILRRHLIV